MKIKNVSTTKLMIGDVIVNGYALELAVDEEKVVYDEAAEKSASLKALIDAGSISVLDEQIEPVELGHGEEYVLYNGNMVTLAAAIEDLAARVYALEHP